MKINWWLLVMTVGVAGAFFINKRTRTLENEIVKEDDGDWPYEKNFKAFPPDIHEASFEGLT